jgi:hypothetical protein
MKNAMTRSLLTALIYTVALGAALGISCLPEHVSCTSAEPAPKVFATEGSIVFALALLGSLLFEWIVRTLNIKHAMFDTGLAIMFAAPILVPFCIGTKCSVERDYWMLLSVIVASLVAVVVRRALILLGERQRLG